MLKDGRLVKERGEEYIVRVISEPVSSKLISWMSVWDEPTDTSE